MAHPMKELQWCYLCSQSGPVCVCVCVCLCLCVFLVCVRQIAPHKTEAPRLMSQQSSHTFPQSVAAVRLCREQSRRCNRVNPVRSKGEPYRILIIMYHYSLHLKMKCDRRRSKSTLWTTQKEVIYCLRAWCKEASSSQKYAEDWIYRCDAFDVFLFACFCALQLQWLSNVPQFITVTPQAWNWLFKHAICNFCCQMSPYQITENKDAVW